MGAILGPLARSAQQLLRPRSDHYRRARVNAWLSTIGRLAGVLFFLVQSRDYWLFGAYDFAFFLPQALLLLGSSRPGAVK